MSTTNLIIVVPCYNEEKTIETFYNAITKEMDNLKEEFEVIFINDGSKDKTKEIAKKLSIDYECIKTLSWRECKELFDNLNDN